MSDLPPVRFSGNPWLSVNTFLIFLALGYVITPLWMNIEFSKPVIFRQLAPTFLFLVGLCFTLGTLTK